MDLSINVVSISISIKLVLFSLTVSTLSSVSSSKSSSTSLRWLITSSHIIMMMNINGTESWLFINTSFNTPQISGPANTSGMERYLQRLAHLDEGLYNDFYGLWIALVVINSLIFLVRCFDGGFLMLHIIFYVEN